MADKELIVKVPDVRLNADAAGLQGRVQGNSTPVVIVRMAYDREDVTREVCGPSVRIPRCLDRTCPAVHCPIEVIREEGDDDARDEDYELDNASGTQR